MPADKSLPQGIVAAEQVWVRYASASGTTRMTRAWLSQLGGCKCWIVAAKTALAIPQRETFLILFELPKAVCGTGDHHACAEEWAQVAKVPVETITKLARRQGLLLAPSAVRNSYINTVADTLTLVAELDGGKRHQGNYPLWAAWSVC